MTDFGMRDRGHGRCKSCDVFLHLEITDSNEGKAIMWKDWAEQETKRLSEAAERSRRVREDLDFEET